MTPPLERNSTLTPILKAAEQAGVTVLLDGEQVKIRYPENRRAELAPLIAMLRQFRSSLAVYLRQHAETTVTPHPRTTWPQDSVDSMAKFARPYARLFPFIGKQIWTPGGVGVLQQVFHDRARVSLLASPDRMTDFTPDDLFPIIA